jgi:hypothetical protein
VDSFSNANWRFGLAAALLATLLDPLLGRGISRLSFGNFDLGKTLTTVAHLWLVASSFGFLAVESVGAIEWVTNAAARLRPGAVAGGFKKVRREGSTIFQGSVRLPTCGRYRRRTPEIHKAVHHVYRKDAVFI